MYVGIARLEYRIPQAGSLKAKRHVLRRMLDRVRVRFKVSAGEVDHLDKWQRTALGVAVLGADAAHVERMLSRIMRFMDDQHLAEPLSKRSEVIRFAGGSSDGLLYLGPLDDAEPMISEPGFEDWKGLDGLDSMGSAAKVRRPLDLNDPLPEFDDGQGGNEQEDDEQEDDNDDA